MLDVCLLGTGGTVPLPERWLTSLLVRWEGKELLIDCGEGTQIAMHAHGFSCRHINTILLTHFHADHISGLPGMLLSIGNAERTEPVLLIGPKGLEHVVRSLLVIAPGLPFELQFLEIDGSEQEMTINGMHIKAFHVNHNVVCYGYTVSIDRAGRFDADRAKALEIPLRFWNPLQKGNTCTDDAGHIYTPDMVLGNGRKGLKVTYTTDTRPAKSIADNAAGSDLFICEGMYGEPEKLAQAKDKKHMTFYEAAELAAKAGVKELWLTHYSPSLTDPREFMGRVREIFPGSRAGKDGKTVVLNYEEKEDD